VPQAASAARKIYPIVKYGDPILERGGRAGQKIRRELVQLVEDMFASMYAGAGRDWRRRKSERACGLRWWT